MPQSSCGHRRASGAGYLLPPFLRFQGSSSCPQTCWGKLLCLLSHLIGPRDNFFIIIFSQAQLCLYPWAEITDPAMELTIQHKLPIYKPPRIEFEESINTNLIEPHAQLSALSHSSHVCEHAASAQVSEVGRQKQKMETVQCVLWAAQEEQQNKDFWVFVFSGNCRLFRELSKKHKRK